MAGAVFLKARLLVTSEVTLGRLYPLHVLPTAGHMRCLGTLANASVSCWPPCSSNSVLRSLQALGWLLQPLVTLRPSIPLGREAACLEGHDLSGTVQVSYTPTSSRNPPHTPQGDTAGLFVINGETKLSKTRKQDQGHADLGRWEESPGLPGPGANTLPTRPPCWDALCSLHFSDTTSPTSPDKAFLMF